MSIASSSSSTKISLSFVELISDSLALDDDEDEDGDIDMDMFSAIATEEDVLEQGLTEEDLGEGTIDDYEVVTDSEDELVDRGVDVWKGLIALRSTNLY